MAAGTDLAGAADDGSLAQFARAMATAHLHQLAEELRPLYPAWPDTVQQYRERRLGLGEMFAGILADLRPVLKFLAATQAHADAARVPDFLGQEPFASMPTVRLYLGEPWSWFVGFLRLRPVLPELSAIPEYEADVLKVGEAMVRKIWNNLGLVVPEHADGGLEVRVSAPKR